MILRPPPWWTLVDIVAVFVWPDSAEAFGKYLQKQAQARSDARTKVNQEENMLTRNGDSDTDNDSGSFFEVDSIEVFGAVLLASLFAVFCFIYVCFLQCWWRCSERGAFKQNTNDAAQWGASRRKKRERGGLYWSGGRLRWRNNKRDGDMSRSSSSGDGNLGKSECTCCHSKQKAWEPIDLEKLIPKEALATITASLVAVANSDSSGSGR